MFNHTLVHRTQAITEIIVAKAKNIKIA